MNSFPHLPQSERALICEQAEARLGLARHSVEKDFWVCWTLDRLFKLPEWGGHLTFKGGTSLSKAWNLIQRFSEDIDIVIDRGFLGFGAESGPESAASAKQRRKRLEELKAACQQRIADNLQPALEAAISERLPEGSGWTLRSDPEDPDGQTLLFSYPTAFTVTGYVGPVVKIELGARSDTWPSHDVTVTPLLSDAFPALLTDARIPVHVLAPERTFWEKAMLLHEEGLRPPGKSRKARLARHYYDLWCLIKHGIATRAEQQPDLFARVAEHREIFFRWNWLDYSTLKRGTLRIVPPADQLAGWRADYAAMQTEMFYGEVPPFDDILAAVLAFEHAFNTAP